MTEALGHAVTRLSGPALRAEHDALDIQPRELEQQPRRSRGVCRIGEILPQVLLRIQQRLQEETNADETNATKISHPVNDEDVTHGS